MGETDRLNLYKKKKNPQFSIKFIESWGIPDFQ